MRVLIHTDEYYPTAQACAYRMQVLADAFTAGGDTVTVIASSANRAQDSAASARPERILYAPVIRMKRKTALLRLLNNLSFAFSSLVTALRVGRADVVITSSPPPLISVSGWLIARCKGARLVYDVRDIWPDVALEMGAFSPDSLYCRVFRRIARFMYRRADVVTTVSPGKVEKLRSYVAALHGRKTGSSHTDKVWLVPNGFDERLADGVNADCATQWFLDDVPVCVYIGNIGLAQGLSALLDLAAKTRHRDARFLCFGMGAEREALERRAREEGLENVCFCGVLDHNKVAAVLSRAALSFIPLKSAAMRDSVPTKVYEALGLGCPVLLLAEGDAVAIVEDIGLGRHVSPSEPERLVEVFDEMLDHRENDAALREEARNKVRERYSRQKAAADFAHRLREQQ